jgi:excisionase family DNA binding protein
MTEARPQDKATIQEAAKTLHIDRKTIYRWINKGLISKHVEGNKTYVILEEVKALCGKVTSQEATSFVAESVASPNIVTVDRPHYEGLLIKLGQYEAERRYLLEYKTGLEAKERELSETRATLAANADELAAVRSELDTNNSELEQARSTITKARNELQRLMEIKQDAEAKGKALLDQQVELETRERELEVLRAENERLRLPWWKKLFRK